MSLNVLSPNWRGHTAEPIDPDTIRFKVVPGSVCADCQGCLFVRQRSAVCNRAAEISGFNCETALPDGRSGIFVLDRSDPRQLEIPEVAQNETPSVAPVDASHQNN